MFDRKFLILCLSLLFIGYACDDDTFRAPVDDFDYAGQAIIDNDSLVDFLGKHYYNDAIDSVRPLVTGATALINDSRLITQDVTELDVDYKLYIFVKEEGSPNPEKLDDFELGWQVQFNNFSLNLNAFYMLYDDQLVLTGERDINGYEIRTNIGESYRLGLELESKLYINSNLNIESNVSLSENKNKNLEYNILNLSKGGASFYEFYLRTEYFQKLFKNGLNHKILSLSR